MIRNAIPIIRQPHVGRNIGNKFTLIQVYLHSIKKSGVICPMGIINRIIPFCQCKIKIILCRHNGIDSYISSVIVKIRVIIHFIIGISRHIECYIISPDYLNRAIFHRHRTTFRYRSCPNDKLHTVTVETTVINNTGSSVCFNRSGSLRIRHIPESQILSPRSCTFKSIYHYTVRI